MSDDGLTIVLDLTGASEWDRISRPFGGVAIRRTTSSRTPGKVNEGIVHQRSAPQLVKCACGTMRMDLEGPHGLQMLGVDKARDCQGAVWRKEGNGWVTSKE